MADGTVIIIGGAEDKVRDRVILSRFVDARRRRGRDDRVSSARRRRSASRRASGIARSSVSSASGMSGRSTRSPGRRPTTRRPRSTVRDATGIFLTGGNQLRLSSTIGGTRLADAILDRFQHGAVVAGTSAGASAMSSHMIAFGASGATPEAPDGPDRGGPRRPAGGDRRPAFPAAEPARPAAQPHRPEPEPARARRRRGHRRRRRPRPHHGGHRARLDHGRRRLRAPRPTPGRSTAIGR